MYTLVPAIQEEIAVYCRIINEAKDFQRSQGFVQWTDDYPNEGIILEDIKSKKGFAVKTGNETAAYLCIDFAGEPAYNHIVGKWNSEQPYAVVHRMALDSKFRNRGLSHRVFSLAEDLCRTRGIKYIRVDTDPENHRMQHILEKKRICKMRHHYLSGRR